MLFLLHMFFFISIQQVYRTKYLYSFFYRLIFFLPYIIFRFAFATIIKIEINMLSSPHLFLHQFRKFMKIEIDILSFPYFSLEFSTFIRIGLDILSYKNIIFTSVQRVQVIIDIDMFLLYILSNFLDQLHMYGDLCSLLTYDTPFYLIPCIRIEIDILSFFLNILFYRVQFGEAQ